MKGRRKGESAGPRLTAGERAINWAKALAIVIPLIGIGAVGNSQTVKKMVYEQPKKEEVKEAKREVAPAESEEKKAIKALIAEVNRISKEIDLLKEWH